MVKDSFVYALRWVGVAVNQPL